MILPPYPPTPYPYYETDMLNLERLIQDSYIAAEFSDPHALVYRVQQILTLHGMKSLSFTFGDERYRVSTEVRMMAPPARILSPEEQPQPPMPVNVVVLARELSDLCDLTEQEFAAVRPSFDAEVFQADDRAWEILQQDDAEQVLRYLCSEVE